MNNRNPFIPNIPTGAQGHHWTTTDPSQLFNNNQQLSNHHQQALQLSGAQYNLSSSPGGGGTTLVAATDWNPNASGNYSPYQQSVTYQPQGSQQTLQFAVNNAAAAQRAVQLTLDTAGHFVHFPMNLSPPGNVFQIQQRSNSPPPTESHIYMTSSQVNNSSNQPTYLPLLNLNSRMAQNYGGSSSPQSYVQQASSSPCYSGGSSTPSPTPPPVLSMPSLTQFQFHQGNVMRVQNQAASPSQQSYQVPSSSPPSSYNNNRSTPTPSSRVQQSYTPAPAPSPSPSPAMHNKISPQQQQFYAQPPRTQLPSPPPAHSNGSRSVGGGGAPGSYYAIRSVPPQTVIPPTPTYGRNSNYQQNNKPMIKTEPEVPPPTPPPPQPAKTRKPRAPRKKKVKEEEPPRLPPNLNLPYSYNSTVNSTLPSISSIPSPLTTLQQSWSQILNGPRPNLYNPHYQYHPQGTIQPPHTASSGSSIQTQQPQIAASASALPVSSSSSVSSGIGVGRQTQSHEKTQVVPVQVPQQSPVVRPLVRPLLSSPQQRAPTPAVSNSTPPSVITHSSVSQNQTRPQVPIVATASPQRAPQRRGTPTQSLNKIVTTLTSNAVAVPVPASSPNSAKRTFVEDALEKAGILTMIEDANPQDTSFIDPKSGNGDFDLDSELNRLYNSSSPKKDNQTSSTTSSTTTTTLTSTPGTIAKSTILPGRVAYIPYKPTTVSSTTKGGGTSTSKSRVESSDDELEVLMVKINKNAKNMKRKLPPPPPNKKTPQKKPTPASSSSRSQSPRGKSRAPTPPPKSKSGGKTTVRKSTATVSPPSTSTSRNRRKTPPPPPPSKSKGGGGGGKSTPRSSRAKRRNPSYSDDEDEFLPNEIIPEPKMTRQRSKKGVAPPPPKKVQVQPPIKVRVNLKEGTVINKVELSPSRPKPGPRSKTKMTLSPPVSIKVEPQSSRSTRPTRSFKEEEQDDDLEIVNEMLAESDDSYDPGDERDEASSESGEDQVPNYDDDDGSGSKVGDHQGEEEDDLFTLVKKKKPAKPLPPDEADNKGEAEDKPKIMEDKDNPESSKENEPGFSQIMEDDGFQMDDQDDNEDVHVPVPNPSPPFKNVPENMEVNVTPNLEVDLIIKDKEESSSKKEEIEIDEDAEEDLEIIEEAMSMKFVRPKPEVIEKGTKEEADKAVDTMRNTLAQLTKFNFSFLAKK